MNKFITALLIALSFAANCYCSQEPDISKGAIIATIQHMEQLTHDQKNLLDRAQYDYKHVEGQRDWWQADDTKHIAGETYWRKRAQVILYALALGCAFFFYNETRRMLVSPVSGWEGLVIPLIAAALGAALGYAFGLYALGWVAQFLP